MAVILDSDIIILAAGKGSRMQSARPKVLHTIAGRSLLEHVLITAQSLTQRPLNIIVGYGAEAVEATLGGYLVNTVRQAQQLGTAHAVQQALPYCRDNSTVLILYGDVPLIKPSTLTSLINQASANSLALLTVTMENPYGYGRIQRDAHQQVTAIVEHKDASDAVLGINEVNTGIMAVNSEHLKQWLPTLSNDNAQREYYLTDIIAIARQEGIQINTEQASDPWEVSGVNDRCQQARMERYVQYTIATQLLTNGVTLIDPERFDCRGEISVGKDVVIDINCIFKGRVSLGDRVTIGANCILEDVTIAAGSVIKDNSIIEGATIHSDCIVGPFARVRPGTELKDNAKVGNFVETKKALIGKASKINHLSYIGDAVLGADVNIGAGTITCNYDGMNKHQTTIGDKVFVGSNTALVAPVHLEDESTIGAGSVINKSVKKNTLALTRVPQKCYEDWVRAEKKENQ